MIGKINFRNRKIKSLYFILKRQYKIWFHEKEVLKKEFSFFPKGTMHIKKNGSTVNCYTRENGKEKIIPKSNKLSVVFARKMQAISELNDANICLAVLGKAIKILENYLSRQQTKRGHLTLDSLPEIFEYEIFALNKKEKMIIRNYPQDKSWHPEGLTKKTNSGIYVRSKSERTIADMLFAYDILFLYEPVVQVGNKIFHPDFLIIRNDGSIILWEHLGLLDDEDYRKSTENKIKEYENIGYYQHTNMICTSEKDLTDPNILARIVEERLL